MLTALQNGVKGGVWFRLIDKIYSPRNLQAAFAKVRANGGAASAGSCAGLPVLRHERLFGLDGTVWQSVAEPGRGCPR